MSNVYVIGGEISTRKFLGYKNMGKFLKKNCFSDFFEDKSQEELLNYFGERFLKKIDRSVQLSLFSSENLISKVNLSDSEKQKTGIFFGNNYAGWYYVEDQMYALYQGESNAINPYVATAWFPAASQGELSIRNNLFGISKTFSLDILSSAIALDFAVDMLNLKTIEYAIVGGHESLISPIIQSSLETMKLVSNTYFPSEAAAQILLTERETEHSLAIITSLCSGDTLNDVLEKTQKNIKHQSINYCILPTVNINNIENVKLLQQDITELYLKYGNIPVGMPSYFMGEVGAANFAIQIVIALWILENQYLPFSYMNIDKKMSFNGNFLDLIEMNIKTIMIIGRDYSASKYFCLVLSKNY